MRSAEVRQRFLAHFERNGHTVVPSAPLPFEDPNLLFVNAGMVQFVPYFLGQQTPPWPRATSMQKCIRTLDIDEVGKTTRHGTFFQMAGNFSFGDYFKAGAIELAWDLSTKSIDDGGYGLDGERIWVTVFLDDDEAIDIWHKTIGMPMERIVQARHGRQLLVDGHPRPVRAVQRALLRPRPRLRPRGRPRGRRGPLPGVLEPRLHAERARPATGPGKSDFPILGELPAKNIDTGMGMERMAALLQGVDNLYEIDQTRPILETAAELAGKVYGAHPATRRASRTPTTSGCG